MSPHGSLDDLEVVHASAARGLLICPNRHMRITDISDGKNSSPFAPIRVTKAARLGANARPFVGQFLWSGDLMTDEHSTVDRDPETLSESDASPRGDASAGDMAADLRALLGARQEVETLLEEASEARRTAAAEGEDILAQAQRVAEELTEGARQDAEREGAAARERAARIMAEAKAEADEIRGKAEVESAAARAAADAELRTLREHARVRASEEARAEFDALRQEANQLFAALEERFGTVRSALTEAESAMRSTLERLDQLRATAGAEAVFALPGRRSEGASEPSDHLAAEAEVGSERVGDKPGTRETRPRGWLFRNQS